MCRFILEAAWDMRFVLPDKTPSPGAVAQDRAVRHVLCCRKQVASRNNGHHNAGGFQLLDHGIQVKNAEVHQLRLLGSSKVWGIRRKELEHCRLRIRPPGALRIVRRRGSITTCLMRRRAPGIAPSGTVTRSSLNMGST